MTDLDQAIRFERTDMPRHEEQQLSQRSESGCLLHNVHLCHAIMNNLVNGLNQGCSLQTSRQATMKRQCLLGQPAAPLLCSLAAVPQESSVTLML